MVSQLEQILTTSGVITERHEVFTDEISRREQHRVKRIVGSFWRVYDFDDRSLYDPFLEELDSALGDAETVALTGVGVGSARFRSDLRAMNGLRDYIMVDPRRITVARPDHAMDNLPRAQGGLGKIALLASHATSAELDDASRYFDAVTMISQAITIVGDQAALATRSADVGAQRSSFIEKYVALVDGAEHIYSPRDCPHEQPIRGGFKT